MRFLPLLLAALLTATATAAPNVLLILSDDLTACLGGYGHPICKTPHLDRLAQQGVRFEKAYCQYPVCGPSRASLMSGLYPNSTRILGNRYSEGGHRTANPELADHPSLGRFLRDRGWFSARVSKIYHMGVPGGIEAGEPGGDDPDCWDWTWNVIGPELYSPGTLELYTPNRAHFGSNFAAMRIPEDRVSTQTDVMATTQAIAILENRAGTPPEQSNRTKSKPDGPFFLAVGLVRPHVPLIAPQHCFDLYDAAAMPLPEVPEGDLDDIPPPARLMDNAKRYHMDEANQRNALAAYFACVTFMDEQVGRLLDALDRLDLRKDTIVIFLSDHGWNLGQHHCWQKLSLWEDSTRVPLIISAPEMKGSAGKTARGIVETVDLYPTVVDLCGLAAEAPATLQGISLRPLLENPERSDWEHTAYTVTHQKGESIRRGPWRYSIWGQAGEELYNHDSDPGEFTNLAQNPEYTSVLESLRTELDRKRRHSLGKD